MPNGNQEKASQISESSDSREECRFLTIGRMSVDRTGAMNRPLNAIEDMMRFEQKDTRQLGLGRRRTERRRQAWRRKKIHDMHRWVLTDSDL